MSQSGNVSTNEVTLCLGGSSVRLFIESEPCSDIIDSPICGALQDYVPLTHGWKGVLNFSLFHRPADTVVVKLSRQLQNTFLYPSMEQSRDARCDRELVKHLAEDIDLPKGARWPLTDFRQCFLTAFLAQRKNLS